MRNLPEVSETYWKLLHLIEIGVEYCIAATLVELASFLNIAFLDYSAGMKLL